MGRAFSFFLFLLLPFFSSAQSYNFLHFTVEDGLSNSSVLDICEDQFGRLWFATQGGGLNYFDGHTFERITIRDGLASNFVRAVISDRKGNIWAATASGISKYDGNHITNFLHHPQEIFSVAVLNEDAKGRIWFSLPTGGIGYIENDSLNLFNKEKGFVDDVVIDIKSDGENVWILTNIQGLFRYDGEKFEHVLSNADFKGFLLSMHLRQDGRMLIGTNRGVLVFNPKNSQEFNYLLPALANSFIRTVTEDVDGNIWAAMSNGVVKLGNDQIMGFSGEQGFTDHSVNVIFSDREGTLWFGTENDGVYKFSGELFFHLNQTHGLNGATVTSIVVDDHDNTWISTNGGGIDIFDGETVINLGTDILPTGYITCSTKDNDGNLWFGTREGILKYDSTEFIRYSTENGLINNGVRCLEVDKEGNLWVGTNSGVSRFDGTEFLNFTEQNGLSENMIWQILPAEDGVYIITREGIDKYFNNRLTTVTRDEKIFRQRLNAVLIDSQKNLWIGYSGYGLARIDAKTKEVFMVNTNDGFSSDFIYNLIWDNEQNLLVGTERGIDKVVLDKNRMPLFIKSYGAVEGFKGLKTYAQAIYKNKDGSIWFGGDKGVYKYQPLNSRLNKVAPLTYISNLKLFYNDIDWGTEWDSVTSWTHLPVNLELPHDKNHIIFNFKGISLKNPDEVKYQFKLENLEDEWSPQSGKSEAAYTNLPPGSYTFKVRAANSDGVWSAQPAGFAFTIRAPFWKTWWFYFLGIVLLIIGISVYYEYRMRKRVNQLLVVEKIRAEEKQNVRKKMARDFHDNMGNQLASITVYVNLISRKLQNSPSEITHILENIEKHTKSLFTGTKDFIWSIDPESDEIHELYIYIKDFGEELFQNTHIDFYSNISPDLPVQINLPSGYSRQIVLIFKEAMTNVLKHSTGDKVQFYLFNQGPDFEFKLRDNGSNPINEEIARGNGLKNMRQRADQIGAEFNLNYKEGTEVSVKFKVNKPGEMLR